MEKEQYIKKIKTLIKEHSSFDGTANEFCPKCGHIVRYGTEYFDHARVLGRNIAIKLGLNEFMQETFAHHFEKLEGWSRGQEPPYSEIARELYDNYLN